MLNIPSAIKTLFQTDGVLHNFRASFPNGEYPDITNANVARESLHFTESLCSQDPFKFGLAEASVIEFETVGIGNMYGMTIVCGIEIDTSSLTAAQITAIQSDPGDGTLVLAAASDIGFGFYRVPLGTFKVTSCPRNHGAMAHRKVTAYTGYTGAKLQNSPYELAKLSSGWLTSYGDYTPNLLRIITAAQAYFDPSIVDGYAVLRSDSISESPWVDHLNNTIGGVQITSNVKWANSSNYVNDRIVVVELADYDIDSPVEWVREQFAANGYEEYADEAAEWVRMKIYPRTGSMPPLGWYHRDYSYISPVDGKIVAYPYSAYGNGMGVSFMSTIPLTLTFPDSTTATSTFNGVTLANCRQKTLTDSFADIRGRYGPTGKNGTRSTFVDCYDLDEIYTGLLEMRGEFAKVNRAGRLVEIALDGSSPVTLTAAAYEECWWDEYDVSPIGTISVTFLDDGGETTADISIGDGASVYDMTDNETLKNLDGTSLSDLETFFAGDFASNAPTVAFTPCEMTMQGWPWIEAGDALEVTAEDGTVIDTFALRVEMSGIQRLAMDVESKAGEIIGEV